MGYYTKHTLSTIGCAPPISLILGKVPREQFESLFFAVDKEGETYDSVKWYRHEADMKRLSKMFPDAVFELHGEGEENSDIWNEYYLNGKVQKCPAKITFDKYDPEKLE